MYWTYDNARRRYEPPARAATNAFNHHNEIGRAIQVELEATNDIDRLIRLNHYGNEHTQSDAPAPLQECLEQDVHHRLPALIDNRAKRLLDEQFDALDSIEAIRLALGGAPETYSKAATDARDRRLTELLINQIKSSKTIDELRAVDISSIKELAEPRNREKAQQRFVARWLDLAPRPHLKLPIRVQLFIAAKTYIVFAAIVCIVSFAIRGVEAAFSLSHGVSTFIMDQNYLIAAVVFISTTQKRIRHMRDRREHLAMLQDAWTAADGGLAELPKR